jgi:hypothetical protein
LKKKNRPVYQPWYERDFWSMRVRRMHPIARLMYRSILQGAWDLPFPGRIPNDEEKLMELADCPDVETWKLHGPSVIAMFELAKSGKFYTNKRQSAELRDTRMRMKVFAERGRAGGIAKRDRALSRACDASIPASSKPEPASSTEKQQLRVPLSSNHNHIHKEAKESQEEEDARALTPLALATKVSEELCLERSPGMLQTVAGAIEFCVKAEGKSPNAAVEFLIGRGKDQIERGGAPNRFWFSDRKWRSQESNNGLEKARARAASFGGFEDVVG